MDRDRDFPDVARRQPGGQLRPGVAAVYRLVDAAARAAREKVVEAAAETDDALIEKYLGGEELTDAEVVTGLRPVDQGEVMLCGGRGSLTPREARRRGLDPDRRGSLVEHIQRRNQALSIAELPRRSVSSAYA